jgi:hypothetical protein
MTVESTVTEQEKLTELESKIEATRAEQRAQIKARDNEVAQIRALYEPQIEKLVALREGAERECDKAYTEKNQSLYIKEIELLDQWSKLHGRAGFEKFWNKMNTKEETK